MLFALSLCATKRKIFCVECNEANILSWVNLHKQFMPSKQFKKNFFLTYMSFNRAESDLSDAVRDILDEDGLDLEPTNVCSFFLDLFLDIKYCSSTDQ